MKFGILGPLLVCADDGREVPVAAARQRTLLAALLVRANRLVPVDELAELVWDGAPPPGAARTLRSYTVRLRHALGPVAAARIVTRDPGYLCRVSADELDTLGFEALCRAGGAARQQADWVQCRAHLVEALSLWRGAPLADIGSQLLHAEATHRLEQARLQALDWRVEADLHLGRHDQLIPELSELVRAHPLREPGYAVLMTALSRAGRRAEALDVYAEARRVLVDQLGVEPGPELRELHRQLLADEPGPEPPAAQVVPHQLPPTVGHFTGRGAELATLDRLAAGAGASVAAGDGAGGAAGDGAGGAAGGGAVVISAIGGTAGVGKTALAVRWAHRVADRYPDGQLYVNLRGYDPAEPVPAADALAGFLSALGVPAARIPADPDERAAAYRNRLAGQRVLILLDNADRPERVRPLLPGTPGCLVLVTSRDSLAGLVARDGATRLDLDVLPTGTAVALLRGLIGPRIDADPDAAVLLAGRCSRLPLALRVAAELAVTRPEVPVAALAAELADLQHRLDHLDAGGDGGTAVRAVFSWSYRQLDPAAARAFRCAGLHPGADVEPHALAALLDTDPGTAGRLLVRLARAHLVDRVGTGRYTRHDLLRGYAAELAAAQDGEPACGQALTRLFDWYRRIAAAALVTLFPAEVKGLFWAEPADAAPTPALVATPGAARAWLDAETDNLIATVARAAAGVGPAGHAGVMARILQRYISFGARLPEALTLHGHALRAARREGDPIAEATALTNLGFIEWELSRFGRAAGYQRQALALFEAAGDIDGISRTLHRLALAERNLGELAQAAEHAERTAALATRERTPLGHARALQSLATTRRHQGRFAESVDLYARVLELLDEQGDRGTRSFPVTELAVIDLRHGRLAPAQRRLFEALELCQQAGNRRGRAEALSQLGLVYLRQGEFGPAERLQREALALHREHGDRDGEARGLTRLARVELAAGRTHEAEADLKTAQRIATALSARLVETEVSLVLGQTALAGGRPIEAAERFTAALRLAEQTGDRDAQAHAQDGRARASHALGRPVPAARYARAARDLYAELGVPHATMASDTHG